MNDFIVASTDALIPLIEVVDAEFLKKHLIQMARHGMLTDKQYKVISATCENALREQLIKEHASRILFEGEDPSGSRFERLEIR